VLEELAVLPLAVLIGVLLGALGGGGAILAFPVLVYAAHLPVLQAVAVAQFVVGSAAAVGTALQAKRGNVEWREVLLFGGAGIPATTLGALLAAQLNHRILMLTFAAVVTVTGLRVFQTAGNIKGGRSRRGMSLLLGFVVGLLTGMLGVGGGFMLVPAMIAFGGLDTRQATASSLPVIALNSLSGAAQHTHHWFPVLWLACTFLGATIVGTYLGLRLGRATSEVRLKQVLGGLLVTIGFLVGAVNSLPH